jgi:hypothetical protein
VSNVSVADKDTPGACVSPYTEAVRSLAADLTAIRLARDADADSRSPSRP